MTRPSNRSGMCLCFWMALMFLPGLSQSAAIDIRKLNPAWEQMEHRVRGLLGPDGQRSLLDMAYVQVAADACPGWAIDRSAVERAMDGLAATQKRDVRAQRAFENEMMNYLGVYTGLLIAESFIDRPNFCKGLERVVARKGGPSRWLRPSTH